MTTDETPEDGKTAAQGVTWSASRVLDILEFLNRRSSPAPASIIASSCHIPRSSTYGLLNLLRERHFVTYHSAERGWSLGSGVFELSVHAPLFAHGLAAVSYTHLRAHETVLDLVCRLLLEKKKPTKLKSI